MLNSPVVHISKLISQLASAGASDVHIRVSEDSRGWGTQHGVTHNSALRCQSLVGIQSPVSQKGSERGHRACDPSELSPRISRTLERCLSRSQCLLLFHRAEFIPWFWSGRSYEAGDGTLAMEYRNFPMKQKFQERPGSRVNLGIGMRRLSQASCQPFSLPLSSLSL